MFLYSPAGSFLRALVQVSLCLLPIAGSAAQDNPLLERASDGAVQMLEAGRPVEGSLATGEARVYGLSLSSLEFLRFSVAAENPGSQLQVFLSGPDGSEIRSLSGKICPFSLYFLASGSGVYRLRVQLGGNETSPEKFTVTLSEQHQASERDKIRTAGNQAWVEAYRLLDQNSADAQGQATRSYEQALSLYRTAGDLGGQAELYYALSMHSFAAKNYAAAVDQARREKELRHEQREYGLEIGVLERIGLYLGRLGKSQEQLDTLNEALSLQQSLGGDPWGRAMMLSGRGDALEALGLFQDALKDKQQALAIFRAGTWRMDYEFYALTDIGHIYEEMGDSDKALYYYYQALAFARERNTPGLEVDMLTVIAGAYGEAGDNEKAREFYRQSLALTKGDRLEEARVEENLAAFYVKQGEYETALRYLEPVQPLFHAANRPVLEAVAWYWIGVVFHKQSKWQQALDALHQALSIWPHPDQMRRKILRELGSTYEDSGDVPKALEYYEKALAESRTANDLQAKALALCGLAEAKRAAHRPADARRDFEAGLTILESVRAQIAGTESRASYFATVEKNYESYVDLLMQMHAEHPDQDFAAAALEASERARARSLLDMLVESNADIHEGADAGLVEREKNLQQRLRARSEYQVRLLMRPHTPQQSEAIARELETLSSEYEETEAAIRVRSPRYAGLTQPAPLDLKGIQRILDSETVLFEYALGEDRSYLWTVTDTEFRSYTLPKRAEIERSVRRACQLLTERSRHRKGESESQAEERLARVRKEYPIVASRLSEMILGPAASLLTHKRLLIVSDGALQYVPFGALPLPGSRKSAAHPRPLLVQSEVVTVPSATTLALLRAQMVGRTPAPKTVAVLADPVFDVSDPRVSKGGRPRTEAVAKGFLPRELERSWAEVATDGRGWQIPRLPFSRREADAIIAHAPASGNLKAVDFRASRSTAMNPLLAEYRIVHFATHGVLDSQTPALSGIVLSLVDERGKTQDGFLRLWDIYNLHLPADLVVLSACQTALGKDIKGEGLVGLTRGFMYAGAARVVASLWEVDDVATAELMAQFYDGVLKKHLAPAAALRAAQLSMAKNRRWQGDPYYWAAFQIQGEWN